MSPWRAKNVAKKYYAVKKGINTGIFDTWEDCQKQVKGFPGANYKSFKTKEEAEHYINNIESNKNQNIPKINVETLNAIAYVDGSFNSNTNEYAYGIVLFYNGEEKHFSGKDSDPSLITMRNVAGEILGAQKAMEYCIKNSISSLTIYHDYEGISKWCSGAWKAKKNGTKLYKNFYQEISSKLNVSFIKVPAHSGIEYNELADNLAKNALGICDSHDIIKESQNSTTASNIDKNDLLNIIELLKEDFSGLSVHSSPFEYGEEYDLEYKKQKIKIRFYKNKNKLLIQGKKEELFNNLTSYIIELLESDCVPEFLNSINELNVNVELVEDKCKSLIPDLWKFPPKIRNTIQQAVYNLNINDEAFDATYIVFPAIRVMEGILKLALKNNNIDWNETESFYVFEKDKKSNKYVLKDCYIKDEHKANLLEFLSEAYTFYHNHRHTLFHWDNPTDFLDTTRILNINEAHDLIKESISIINLYCKL